MAFGHGLPIQPCHAPITWMQIRFGDEMEKTKSLALAIGLNFLLPGTGYLYYGKWFVGILGCALIIAMYSFSTGIGIVVPWFIMNVIMFLDMFILHGRSKRKAEQASMIRCGSCAELIRKEAKKCKHCGEVQAV